ncbi:MAG TPA: thioredoxin [Candidatus Magasanikbacteria bacterium]|nr:thioredoxin [Candidatus Magasanikbacteria bacterium]
MAEVNLTDANFASEIVKFKTPVLVDFWAPWCGPCQMMLPIVEELANEFSSDKASVVKVNIDENPETAGKYNVMSIPTFLVLKNGQVVDQMVGGVPKERLKAMLEKHI